MGARRARIAEGNVSIMGRDDLPVYWEAERSAAYAEFRSFVNLSEDARLRARADLSLQPYLPPCYSQESPIIELLHTLVDYP